MNFSVSRIVPPLVEPVSLDEALNQCHANAGIEDDWFIARIRAGREAVETFTKRSLAEQTWVMRIVGAIPQVIQLPRSPVREIKSITHAPGLMDAGTEIDLDTVKLITTAFPSELVLPSAMSGVLEVKYGAGYEPELLPEPLRDAILLYVSYSYSNREGEEDIPAAFYNLLEPYRIYP